MKKNIFSKIVCSLLFISIIFASVVALTFVVRPKADTKKAGYRHVTAAQIIAEKENTIDVLVLGDSLSYRSFSPLRVWKNSGITSYVCGTPSQRLFYSEEFLHLAFETQKPKVVIVETNGIFRKTEVDQIIENKLESNLSFFRYHNRWKTVSKNDLRSALSVDYSTQNLLKGYRFSRKAKRTNTKGYMAYSDELEPIKSVNKALIKSISRFCKKNGAKLVLYSAPSVENYDYPRHNALVALSKELECEYIDMNLLRKEVPVNWKYCSTDGGDHLNYVGAIKVSDYFAKYLTELNLFEDKRESSEYSGWNNALSTFEQKNNLKDDSGEEHRAKKRSSREVKKKLEKEQEKLRNATGNPNAVLPTNSRGELTSLTAATKTTKEQTTVSEAQKTPTTEKKSGKKKSKSKTEKAAQKKQSSAKKKAEKN